MSVNATDGIKAAGAGAQKEQLVRSKLAGEFDDHVRHARGATDTSNHQHYAFNDTSSTKVDALQGLRGTAGAILRRGGALGVGLAVQDWYRVSRTTLSARPWTNSVTNSILRRSRAGKMRSKLLKPMFGAKN